MKKHFEAELVKDDFIETCYDSPEMNVIMTGVKMMSLPVGTFMEYWYGGLQVIVEAWDALGLEDEEIDRLVADPKATHLRRFRNSAFHYQPDYLSPKRQEILNDPDSVEYVRALSNEFGRWFLDYFKENPANPTG